MASWNIRTLIGDNDGGNGPRRKTALLASELDRYSIDVAALSETRLSDEGSIIEGNYTIFWRGHPEGKPRQHGVGIAIKNTHLRSVSEEPNYINERLMTLRVPLVRGEHMLIISAYAPTLAADDEQKDKFYDALDYVLCKACKKDKIVLFGDFNARVGNRCDLWRKVLGPHGVGNMNSNGIRLLSLCSQHNLTITNTLFRLKHKHKTSWMHPRSKKWHLIDFVIVRRSQLGEVLITRAMRGAECWADHRLIISKMRLKMRPAVRRAKQRFKKINCAGLSNKQLRGTFEEKVNQLVQDTGVINSCDLNNKWDAFSSNLISLAKDVLGTTPRKHRDWFEENNTAIQDLLKAKNHAHVDCLKNPTSTVLRQRFARLRSEAQKCLRDLEDSWWKQLSLEMQGYADTNNIHRFYECTKRINGPIKRNILPVRAADGTSLIRDRKGILSRWAEHFNSLLNACNPSDHTVLQDLPSLPACTELDLPPTLDEVVGSLKGMKPRKSPGPDQIPSELLIHGGAQLHSFLHELICTIWNCAKVPNSWKDAIIITIYKNKGDRTLCGNSRGVSLLSTAGKTFAKLLLNRLIAHVSENILPETQCGFRGNRSTVDMIFAARQLFEKSREQHQNLFVAFIDLSKAFDSVDRTLLWKVLQQCGCTKQFTKLLESLHTGMTARIKVGEDLSEPFVVSRGVKQGCVLAPVLFNIYVQCITHLLSKALDEDLKIGLNYRTDRNLFDVKKLKAKTKIQQTKLLELQYADDCALVADSPEVLQTVLTYVSKFYRKMGLNINIGKTEFMQFSPPHVPRSSTAVTIDSTPLKQVESFKYLGSHISSNCHLDDELSYRVGQATRAYGRLSSKVFHNKNITLSTKIMVYNAVVLSSLLYGSETWTLYHHQTRMLESFHMRSLRRILGVSWKQKVPNSEVLKRTSSVSLENILHRSHLRWLGHVIRMDDTRLPKQMLYGELSQGSRSVGRQLKRYRDESQRVLRACNIRKQHLEATATDRKTWRSACMVGLKSHEASRLQWLQERRKKRKEKNTVPSTQSSNHICSDCGRDCNSPIGLFSHRRVHKTKQ